MPDTVTTCRDELQRATYYGLLVLRDFEPPWDEPLMAELLVAAASANEEPVSAAVAVAVMSGLTTGLICALAEREEQE